jgi:hypothetical protein
MIAAPGYGYRNDQQPPPPPRRRHHDNGAAIAGGIAAGVLGGLIGGAIANGGGPRYIRTATTTTARVAGSRIARCRTPMMAARTWKASASATDQPRRLPAKADQRQIDRPGFSGAFCCLAIIGDVG